MPNVNPPAGWQNYGFDDSSWGFAAIIVVLQPNDEIWAENPQRSDTEQALFREHFTMPTVAAISASLHLSVDGQILAVYVNGTALVVHYPFLPQTAQYINIPIGILNIPGDNVLAIEAEANGHIASVPIVAYQITYTS